MKLRFLTLMLPMLNFGSNSVERSRSAVAMGIQSSDFVHQIAIKDLWGQALQLHIFINFYTRFDYEVIFLIFSV